MPSKKIKKKSSPKRASPQAAPNTGTTQRRNSSLLIDRHQTDTALLRKNEEQFEAAFNMTSIGFCQAEPLTGRLLRVNRAFCAMVGYEEAELLNRPFIEITYPDDRTANLENYHRLIRGETAEYRDTKRYVRKDGRVIWGDVTVNLVRDSDGRPWRTVALIQDITERRRAEETLQLKQRELLRSQAQLQDLASKLFMVQDHERQQIAGDLHDDFCQRAVALNLDVAILERYLPPLPELFGSTLMRMREELAQLGDDLRNLAYQLHPSSLNRLGLRPAMADHIEKVMKRTNLQITLTFQNFPDSIPDEWSITLFRVFQEILQNVVKHAKATEVVVKLRSSSKGIGLAVIDNGKGFDTRDESSQHKGLGLISIQERLRKLNGCFTIHSGPADGTKVCAWIPFRDNAL